MEFYKIHQFFEMLSVYSGLLGFSLQGLIALVLRRRRRRSLRPKEGEH